MIALGFTAAWLFSWALAHYYGDLGWGEAILWFVGSCFFWVAIWAWANGA
jgi:hypothetical protein